MSEKFEASRGGVVVKHDSGDLTFDCYGSDGCPAHHLDIGIGAVQALREFFLHERDRELGRWRDPENPDRYVRHGSVGPRAGRGERRWLTIVDERTELSYSVAEDYDSAGMGDLWETAKRYFAAHPESKPWHDAKPGECWRFEMKNGRVHGGVINADRYLHSIDSEGENLYVHVDSPMISAGRRIWPEVSDGA